MIYVSVCFKIQYMIHEEEQFSTECAGCDACIFIIIGFCLVRIFQEVGIFAGTFSDGLEYAI